MTRAVMILGPEGYRGFTLTGHAGYAPSGRDIVCAAVSALSQTCVNALETVAGVTPQVREDSESGRLEVSLPQDLPPLQGRDARVLLAALRQGLSDLAQAYPRYVHLQERRELP